MSIKLITAGIPFYAKSNVDHLKVAIESVINQSYRIDDIHLIQDGEVSESISSVVKNYVNKNNKIRLLKFPKMGLAAVLNNSIKKSNSKYYARMDADDISKPERLEKQLLFLEENSDVDILGTWAIEFNNQKQLSDGFVKKLPNEMKAIKNMFHYRNPLVHSSVMFRTSVFEKIGLYNPTFYTDQDLELWGRAISAGIIISNLQEPLLMFRNTDVIKRRSSLPAIYRQIKARYLVNTYSIRLNLLKICAILFRFLPYNIKKAGYNYLR